MSRIICWFSGGIASAVATKKAIELNAGKQELVIACIYLKNEHPDHARFEKDCEKWFGQEIVMLRDEKYGADVDTVIEKTRYMSGVRGARCTKELKKQVRYDWQRHDDIHVMGFTVDEESRLDRIIDAESELEFWAPLIDLGITKKECFGIFQESGIDIPAMYKLGYHNSNCIGCVKASGAGYWNKIRKDFPDVFNRRAHQEKMINVALVKMSKNKIAKKHPEVLEEMKSEGYEPKVDSRGSMRIPLRFLPEDAGSHKDLDIGDCGFYCEMKK